MLGCHIRDIILGVSYWAYHIRGVILGKLVFKCGAFLGTTGFKEVN